MMVTRASIFVSVGLCEVCVVWGEGFLAGPRSVDAVGGSTVDLDEVESESRRRECGFSAEMMEWQEVVEPVLWLADVDVDADNLDPDDLVERRCVKMRGIGELDSLEGFLALGVWVEVSSGGSKIAVFLPFSLILRSPDHTGEGR